MLAFPDYSYKKVLKAEFNLAKNELKFRKIIFGNKNFKRHLIKITKNTNVVSCEIVTF